MQFDNQIGLYLSIAQTCRVLGISRMTWNNWREKAWTPKLTNLPGYELPKVSADDLALFIAMRDRDREITGKFWLRRPDFRARETAARKAMEAAGEALR